jgi:hypothetical protein
MSRVDEKQTPEQKQAREELELIPSGAKVEGKGKLCRPESGLSGYKLSLAMALAITGLVDYSYVSLGVQGIAEMKRTGTNAAANPGGKIASGLAARESQITGILDPQSLTGSFYWTCVVHNSTSQQQEARFSIVLPDGAAVSRATLWINGIPQEAAFNSTTRVEHAYNWITRQHRDPLLVTQTSPGHISIKAAPVMPGRDMQFRLGITAMGSCRGNRAQFKLPCLELANMDIACRHNLHLESQGRLYANNGLLQTQFTSSGFLSKGSVPASDLKQLEIEAATNWSAGSIFAARATHSSRPAYIVAKVEPGPSHSLQILLSKTMYQAPVLLNSNEAAHRLSTLWAHAEIERLNSVGAVDTACQLANAYRVVSSVSGATVLENESDYRHENLERNIYASLSYMPPGFVDPAFKYDLLAPPVQHSTQVEKSSQYTLPILFPYESLLFREVMKQPFYTITHQLNRLNSVTNSEPYTDVSLSAESLANSGAVGEEKLRELCTKIKVAGCFSGVIGNMLASALAGDSNKFNYLDGNGELPYSVVQAFETPGQVALSALGIATIAMLIIANFAGSAFCLLGSASYCRMRFGLVKAVFWFMAAILVPDFSLAIFVFMLSTKLAACLLRHNHESFAGLVSKQEIAQKDMNTA